MCTYTPLDITSVETDKISMFVPQLDCYLLTLNVLDSGYGVKMCHTLN